MMKQTRMMGRRMIGITLLKFRQSFSQKCWLAMTCCMTIAALANTTQAQWGSHGGGGSHGSYGAAGYGRNSGSGFSGGSTGGTGHVRRIAARIHDHHANRHGFGHKARHGSSGGSGSNGSYSSYGGYGSTGGYSSSVGYGSSGGFSSSYRSASTGTLTMMSSSSVARPISQLKSMAAQSTVVGLPIQLTVEVPNDAKVFVNDRPTTSLGATREFTSRNLEQGKQYDFRVRAEMMNKDGKWVSETQQTSMRAGESEALRFTFPDEPQLLVTSQND
ncbi:MAG: TIGR03000 domain-containing protein [Planctomycetota bacterium]|nr:TIGR03000 domain-containing protein [Planctomycetota bacterium]